MTGRENDVHGDKGSRKEGKLEGKKQLQNRLKAKKGLSGSGKKSDGQPLKQGDKPLAKGGEREDQSKGIQTVKKPNLNLVDKEKEGEAIKKVMGRLQKDFEAPGSKDSFAALDQELQKEREKLSFKYGMPPDPAIAAGKEIFHKDWESGIPEPLSKDWAKNTAAGLFTKLNEVVKSAEAAGTPEKKVGKPSGASGVKNTANGLLARGPGEKVKAPQIPEGKDSEKPAARGKIRVWGKLEVVGDLPKKPEKREDFVKVIWGKSELTKAQEDIGAKNLKYLQSMNKGGIVPMVLVPGQKIFIRNMANGAVMGEVHDYWRGSAGTERPATNLPPGTHLVDTYRGEVATFSDGKWKKLEKKIPAIEPKSEEEALGRGDLNLFFNARFSSRKLAFTDALRPSRESKNLYRFLVVRVPSANEMMGMKDAESFKTSLARTRGLELSGKMMKAGFTGFVNNPGETAKGVIKGLAEIPSDEVLLMLGGTPGFYGSMAKVAMRAGDGKAISAGAETRDEIEIATMVNAGVVGETAMAAGTLAATKGIGAGARGIARGIGRVRIKGKALKAGAPATPGVGAPDVPSAKTKGGTLPGAGGPEVPPAKPKAKGGTLPGAGGPEVPPAKPKAKGGDLGDTMPPAVVVDPEARGWQHTARQTAPIEVGPTPGQARHAKLDKGKPRINQPQPTHDLYLTVKHGPARNAPPGKPRAIRRYPDELVASLSDTPQTRNNIQETFRKAGLRAHEVKDWIGKLERRANDMGMDARSAQRAVHSHIEAEAGLIKHFKDRYKLSWKRVNSWLSDGSALHAIREKEFVNRFTKSWKEVNSKIKGTPEGIRLFNELGERAEQEAAKYVQDLLDLWNRGGLKLLVPNQ